MTVSYTSEVATITGIGVFWKLLWRWRGSIYKLIWKELIIYIAIYYTLRSVNHYALDVEQQKIFADVTLYCRSYSALIPLAFVLGFYVQLVMTRWWQQYTILPWPDTLAVFVTTVIHGLDERGRLMRRTVMRYVNLSMVLTLSMISPRVKKRFPTFEHLLEAGFMTTNEKKIFDGLSQSISHPLYWLPLVWAGSIVTRARKEGRIRDDFAVKTLVDTINEFRGGLGGLLGYDMISIPLVYTQVVTLAVYSFFMSTLMGAQFVTQTPSPDRDLYVPWFTLLQYLFYVGWLKVAETLVNPFGEDDDDFELNWIIDRNIQVSYLIVDEIHNEYPELVQDKYWDEVMPTELPYTVATTCYRKPQGLGSTAQLEMTHKETLFVPHPEVDSESDEESDDGGIITPTRKRKNAGQPDVETGSIDIPKTLKQDNPELWAPSSVPRNESSSILNLLPQFKLLQRKGSLKSAGSSTSLAMKAGSVRQPFESRRVSNRKYMDQALVSDEKNPISSDLHLPFIDAHPTDSTRPRSRDLTQVGERLESMAEEELSEAVTSTIETEESPLIRLEDRHAVQVIEQGNSGATETSQCENEKLLKFGKDT